MIKNLVWLELMVPVSERKNTEQVAQKPNESIKQFARWDYHFKRKASQSLKIA